MQSGRTDTADRGFVFDPLKTQEYPLNGRQTYMLMSLTPGVVFTQEQFGASGFSGTRGWDVNAAIRSTVHGPHRFSDIRDPNVGPSVNLATEKAFQITERYKVQSREGTRGGGESMA